MMLKQFKHSALRPSLVQWSMVGFVWLLCVFAAAGDTLVVPNSMATSDATFGSGNLRASNWRSQTVYGSSQFPPGIALIITELRYRPDRTFGSAFSTTIASFQVNLSTTTRSPEALSTAFA